MNNFINITRITAIYNKITLRKVVVKLAQYFSALARCRFSLVILNNFQ